MDVEGALAELHKLKRELRRMKFMDGAPARLIASLERVCEMLCRRCETLKERK